MEIRRRDNMQQWTAAEHAIWNAQQEVEKAGASRHLTNAGIALSKAREHVADHVDDIPEPLHVTINKLPYVLCRKEYRASEICELIGTHPIDIVAIIRGTKERPEFIEYSRGQIVPIKDGEALFVHPPVGGSA